MNDELWLPVAEHGYAELYEVSNLGRVRRIDSGLVLKPQPRGKGYLQVNLSGPCGMKTLRVHRLVAGAWLSVADPERSHVNHSNGNKENNAASNLEWCTNQENVRHAWANGLYQKRQGEKAPHVLLDDAQVVLLRQRQSGPGCFQQWGEEFGVRAEVIRRAYTGQTFSHLPAAPTR